MKIVIRFLRKIALAFGMIYTMDLILSGAEIFVPINIISLSIGSFLGIFGIIGMIVVIYVLK